MDQSSEQSNTKLQAIGLAVFIEEHGGENVTCLDISGQSGFADFFVIASAESQGRLRGLYRRAHEKVDEIGLVPRQSPKRNDESGWLLLDCGSIIVHLMLDELRDFYELEKLWFDAEHVYPV